MKKQLISFVFIGLICTASSYANYYQERAYVQEREYVQPTQPTEKKEENLALITSPPSNNTRWFKNPENREAYLRGNQYRDADEDYYPNQYQQNRRTGNQYPN